MIYVQPYTGFDESFSNIKFRRKHLEKKNLKLKKKKKHWLKFWSHRRQHKIFVPNYPVQIL